MQLISAVFSWEVDKSGGNTILFTSLKAAKRRAKELIQYEIDSHIEYCEKYNTGPDDLLLTVEFERVTTVKLTAQALCNIINSTGGRYVSVSVPVEKIETKWSAEP